MKKFTHFRFEKHVIVSNALVRALLILAGFFFLGSSYAQTQTPVLICPPPEVVPGCGVADLPPPDISQVVAVGFCGVPIITWCGDELVTQINPGMAAADNQGNFWSIDVGSGSTEQLVGFAPSTEIEWNHDLLLGYAQAPDGLFLGTTFTPAGTTQVSTAPYAFNGLEWVGNVLYGTAIQGPLGPSELRILDPLTGASVLVGATGVGPITGLAYDAGSGTMYGSAGGGGTTLYTINLADGSATPVGDYGVVLGSLEFGNDGNLYGGGGQVNSGFLFLIDPTIPSATPVGPTGLGTTITGLAAIPSVVLLPPSCQLIVTRCYTATDDCGNVVSCVQAFAVIDDVPPTIVAPPAIYDCGSVPPPDPNSILAFDNCGAPAVVTFCGEEVQTGPTQAGMVAADNVGNLWSIDVGSASVDALFAFAPVTEIEWSPDLAIGYAQAPDGLFAGTVLTLQGVSTVSTAPYAFNGLEWVGTDLYGTAIQGPLGPSELRILDPLTGASVLVGATGVGPLTGLAYDAGSATMYASSGGGGSILYTINLADGLATAVGDYGVVLGSLEYGNDGLLYGGGGQANRGNLYLIDPTIPSATLIGATGLGTTITGLAAVPSVVLPPICPTILLRTYKATDECGNTSTYQQLIGVIDTLPPVATFVPADTTLNCDDDIGGAEAIQPVFEDACFSELELTAASSISQDPDCPGNQVIMRTWTATDSCGNSISVSQTITIVDITGPEIICPAESNTVPLAEYVIDNSVAFNYIDISGTGTNVITGDDVAATVTLGAPFTLYGEMLTQMTAATNGYLSSIAGDSGGDLSNDCPINAWGGGTYSTGNDDANRIVPLHDDYDVDPLADPNSGVYYQYFASSPYPHPSGVDYGASIFQYIGDHFNATGTADVEWEAILFNNGDIIIQYLSDPEGGSSSTSGIMQGTAGDLATTIFCNTGGAFVANSAVGLSPYGGALSTSPPPGEGFVISTDEDTCAATFILPIPEVMDACGDVVEITYELAGATSGSGIVDGVTELIFPLGTTIVTYTAVDECGNSSSCSWDLIVEDQVPPVLECPDDIIVDLGPGECEKIISWPVSAVDNCEEFLTTTFLPTTFGANNFFAGNMFDVTNISGDSRMITSFDIHTSELGGTNNIAIYRTTDAESFAGNETNGIAGASNANWTFLGAVDVVPQGLGNPTPVPLGGFMINPGETYGIYIIRTDGNNIQYTNGNNTYEDGVLRFDGGIGWGGPAFTGPQFGGPYPDGDGRTWNGNIHYALLEVIGSTVLEQTEGLPSGSTFEGGTTTVNTYVATDIAGNTSECTFSVTVNDYSGPVNTSLACNDQIQISVDDACEAFIGTDLILEGGPYKCYDDYLVEVEGFGSGMGGVTIGSGAVNQLLTVTVTDPETGVSCWGQIYVEDKLPPIIECVDVTVNCGESTEPVFSDPIVGSFATVTVAPNAVIGPDAGTVTESTLNLAVPAGATVTDVNLIMNVTHTFMADLSFELIAPDGTTAFLQQTGCAGLWTFNFILDDEGLETNACADFDAPGEHLTIVGGFWPLDPVDGANASGTWTLAVTDNFNLDEGTLFEWGVEVTYDVLLPYAPTVTENCGTVDLEYSDEEVGDDCTGLSIVRTWTATDASGNSASCLQTITVNPLTLDELACPDTYIGECGGSTDPAITGWPTINGIPIAGGNICNIFATYKDLPLADCGGGSKLVRTWTVLDWCTQEVVKCQQTIKLSDNAAPVLTCPAGGVYGADPWFCLADIPLEKPFAYDACETPFTLTPVVPEGVGYLVALGNYYVWNDVPYGEWEITWIAEDACGNTSSCSYYVEVVDDVPPVAICDEHTIVSLTFDDPLDEGLTKVSADIFDDGSYDNCSDITFTARRMESCIDFDWTTNGAGVDEIPNGIVNSRDRGTVHRPLVPFSCCDVGAGPIMIELAVIDGYGNTNFCMVEVEVQDKLAPYIECPPNVFVTCDFWFDAQETAGFVPQEQDVLTPVFGKILDAYEYDESDREHIDINDPANNLFPQPWHWGFDGWADDNCDVDVTVRVRIFDDCSGADVPGATLADAAALCSQLGLSPEDCADVAANLNQYRIRLVERTFKAEDGQGNSSTCKQKIWVIDLDPYYITDQTCNNPNPNDGVIWPCDITLDDCPSGDLTPEELGSAPVIFDDNCSLVGVTYDDQRFDFVEGACFKIIRTWSVIDWCQFNAATGEGYWEYVQVIKVLDEEGAHFLDCPAGPVEFCVEDANVELPANNQVFLGENDPNASSCSAHISMKRTVVETCSDWVEYDVKVYPYNGSDYIQVVPKTQVSFEGDTAVLNFDTKTSPVFAVRTYGLPYNSRYCDDQYYHRILWSVEDGCGNLRTCEYLFRLEDCKKPSPVCIAGLSTVVMPASGEVTIWAVDFNASSFDDCTSASDLLYSFSGNTYQPSRSFTCDDIEANGSPSFIVEIWAADEGNDENCNGIIDWTEKNKDFCTTFIIVDDNEGVCGTSGAVGIGGTVETEDLETVEQVNVNLVSPNNAFPSFTTTGDGNYSFINLPYLQDYTVTAERNDDPKNGISTLDLVRIQRHLLGIDPFTSPYKLIAADANNSESVSAIDLVEIRKLLLGIYTEFPNNTSWRFVAADYEFTDPSNPWPFAEEIDIAQLTEMSMENDFMGVKVGDVNGTVQANAQSIENRSGRPVLTLVVEEQQVVAGEQVSVSFSTEELEDVLGYQFTIQTEGLEYVNYAGGLAGIGEEHLGILADAITTSYHQMTPLQVSAEEVLFTLNFKATASGKLSEMLDINSVYTEAEAYNGTEDILDINLTFQSDAVTTGEAFSLYQNEPNPFSKETVIRFDLPEAMQATLTVFDVTGKVLTQVEGDYAQGYNEVKLQSKDLSATGVMYYRLDADKYTATKKMIVID